MTADRTGIRASSASPPGEGAIGVIEVNGNGAVGLVDRIFRSPRGRRLEDSCPGDLLYGHIVEDDLVLDEVLIRMVGNHPEHLEINCHGGAAAHTAVMALLNKQGIRQCAWRDILSATELSRNMDTIRHEALERIPAALTLRASLMLIAVHNGALSAVVESDEFLARRDELLELAPYGIALCEPLSVAIVGKPNVGKSTLANALLGTNRVIASAIPGTTRDAVATFMDIEGVPLRLVDTAGIGNAAGELDMLAAEKAVHALRKADLVLCVLDGSSGITTEDERLLKECAGMKAVIVINKSDLPPDDSLGTAARNTGIPSINVSALKKTGIKKLTQLLTQTLFGAIPDDVSRAIPFTARQATLLDKLDESNTMEIRREMLCPAESPSRT